MSKYNDVIDNGEAAFLRYRCGELSAAAAAIERVLRFAEQRSGNDGYPDTLPDYLALGIMINIALGRTAEAERFATQLDNMEQVLLAQLRAQGRSIARLRSVRFPRQTRRILLAATGRYSQAIDLLDAEEEANTNKTLWEGSAARLRVELAARSERFQEVLEAGNAWLPVRDLERDTRSWYAGEGHLLVATVHLTRARAGMSRRSNLRQAQRQIDNALEKISGDEDDTLVRLSAQLLLGQRARLSGSEDARTILEAGRRSAEDIGHRDLGSRFSRELADLAIANKEFVGAKSMAHSAMQLARSVDHGRSLRPTLDAAHACCLSADGRLLHNPATFVSHHIDRGETIILVHGTFAAPKAIDQQWYERKSAFCEALDAQLATRGSPVKCWAHLAAGSREFFWSGLNDWVARHEASTALASYIEALHPKWRCHIVAHSHGGNVAHQALDILSRKEVKWDGRIVTLGTPFFHDTKRQRAPRNLSSGRPATELEIDQVSDAAAASILNPRALAISSADDEALRILRLALEIPQLPGVPQGPWFWSAIRSSLSEGKRVARARNESLGILPRSLATILRSTVTGVVARRAWGAIRDRITGLASFGVEPRFLRVRPQVAVYGMGHPARYAELPEEIVAAAKGERERDVSGAYAGLQRLLDGDEWSLGSVDQFLESIALGNIVHGTYYRHPACIDLIARWLVRPVPVEEPEPFVQLISEEINNPFGVADDIWNDNA